MTDIPETRYARTPRGYIAYQVTGTGAQNMLHTPGSVSHVELRWEIPHLVRLHRRLAPLGRTVSLDPLGIGASDALPDPPPTTSETADDLMRVLDAAGMDRAVMIASNHSVPVAITVAAEHPERIEKLVCLGGYARLLASSDYPDGIDPAAVDAFFDACVPLWGLGSVSATIYDVQPAEYEVPLYARLERATFAPGGFERVLRWITSSDVRDRLEKVDVPVLVFGIETRLIPLAVTQRMVDGLHDVRYIELGQDPVTSGEGLDEMVAEIAEFVTGSRARSHADRQLAAVLFTDLVGSTGRAAKLGDDRWRDVLHAFRLAVRREIERHGGREVNTRGDDFLVVFDRASNAIECARSLRDAVAPMNLGLRSGIHVGEVEQDGADLTGVAVHVGARVAALAEAQEILVTTAAREAVAGMAWTFVDRGAHELRGVPGEWHLWAVTT